MFNQGDPELERELRSEISHRSRRRRDVLMLLGGMTIALVLLLLLGPHDAVSAASSTFPLQP